jgi:rhodanese-related sulfurtransferase
MKRLFRQANPREFLAVLLASVVLGLAYNASSPLGVSFSQSAPPPAKTFLTGVAAPPAETDPSLHNETITAVVVSSGPADQPSPARSLPASLPWAEVKSLLAKNEIVLVDGRETAAYQMAHIPGALSLPLQTLADRIGAFAARYPKDKPLVIYCASIHCAIAQAEAAALTGQYGYLNVREMPGGFAEWRVAENSTAPATGTNP